MKTIVTGKHVSERIKEYIDECIVRGHRPSIREIGKKVGVSSTSYVWEWVQRFGQGLPPAVKKLKEPKPPKIYKYRRFPVPSVGYKYCRSCFQEKSLECFTTDNARKDNKHTYCNECIRDKHRESYRRNPQPRKDSVVRWGHKNPEKVRAHRKLNMAVSAGRITKPENCQLCGKVARIEAHHWKGYSEKYTLDVQWLCRPCHRKEDAKSETEQMI